MRKLFWSCFAGGVLLVAAVFTTAHLAVRHPDSIVGKTMYGASQVAFALNPFTTFGPGLAHVKSKKPAPVHIEGDGEEPAEIGDFHGLGQPIVVAEPAPAAPILIPEDEPMIPPADMPIGQEGPAVEPDPFLAGTECPPSEVVLPPPMDMPYCHDEETCEDSVKAPCQKHCGRGCHKECSKDCHETCEQPSLPCGAEEELLHMPRIAGEDEEQEEGDETPCPFGCDRLMKMFEKMLKEESCPKCEQPVGSPEGEKPAQTPDCREDAHRHHHYNGCPYTGRTYPPSCPSMPSCKPSAAPMPKANGSEEGSEDGSKQAIKKMRRIENRAGECSPAHPEVDTMEYRPSDRPLYDYGHGPL
jgi:hypothetical protein